MQPINNQGVRHELLYLISHFINKSNTLWFSYHGQIFIGKISRILLQFLKPSK